MKEESESSDTYYHHKRDITEPASRSLYSYTQDSKPEGNQIYLVTLRPTQLTQASFLQKSQMLQNVFLIFLMMR